MPLAGAHRHLMRAYQRLRSRGVRRRQRGGAHRLSCMLMELWPVRRATALWRVAVVVMAPSPRLRPEQAATAMRGMRLHASQCSARLAVADSRCCGHQRRLLPRQASTALPQVIACTRGNSRLWQARQRHLPSLCHKTQALP
jgi:hypothetical protein